MLCACAVYSLVSLVANYVFNKALGEKSPAPLYPVCKSTNIYDHRTEPALTVGQTAVSQSDPLNIPDFYSNYSR